MVEFNDAIKDTLDDQPKVKRIPCGGDNVSLYTLALNANESYLAACTVSELFIYEVSDLKHSSNVDPIYTVRFQQMLDQRLFNLNDSLVVTQTPFGPHEDESEEEEDDEEENDQKLKSVSLHWHPKNPNVFFTIGGDKKLKFFDITSLSNPKQVAFSTPNIASGDFNVLI